jgi:hypothetical protein
MFFCRCASSTKTEYWGVFGVLRGPRSDAPLFWFFMVLQLYYVYYIYIYIYIVTCMGCVTDK